MLPYVIRVSQNESLPSSVPYVYPVFFKMEKEVFFFYPSLVYDKREADIHDSGQSRNAWTHEKFMALSSPDADGAFYTKDHTSYH